MVLSIVDEALPIAKERQQSTPVNTESDSEHKNSATIHPHNIQQYNNMSSGTSSGHQFCGMPHLRMFQDQSELIVPRLRDISINTESIQDNCERDLSAQELVVSRSGPLILSIKEEMQEKIEQIQKLKIKLSDLEDSLRLAESREEQCRVDIAKKDEEIESLKQYYEELLADTSNKLQRARDEAAKLKQDNQELRKKLEDDLTRVKNEYQEKLKMLENAKEVECLKLQLQHKDETHKLELQVKELKCSLAEKNAEVQEKKATISELEKKQLEQQLKQERESKQQQQELIASLQERLQQHSSASNPQVEVPTSIASNDAIKISPETLQCKPTNLSPRLDLAEKSKIVTLKNGSSFPK